jgi:hypothetical protein
MNGDAIAVLGDVEGQRRSHCAQTDQSDIRLHCASPALDLARSWRWLGQNAKLQSACRDFFAHMPYQCVVFGQFPS